MTVSKETDSPPSAHGPSHERPRSASSRQPSAQATTAPAIQTTTSALSRTATFMAVAVMVVYVAALWVLFVNRADKNWDRMVYLLSGFEAVVFVAVGAIFGTTVQRASVDAAHAQARQARTEAKAANERAEAATAQSASGQALAAGIRSYSQARRLNSSGAAETRHDSGIRGQDAGSVDPDLRILMSLADEFFPRET